ncbi:MAG: hypothetical protein ACOZBG_00070 [Candidatus Micrarchaeota archaeon]
MAGGAVLTFSSFVPSQINPLAHIGNPAVNSSLGMFLIGAGAFIAAMDFGGAEKPPAQKKAIGTAKK